MNPSQMGTEGEFGEKSKPSYKIDYIHLKDSTMQSSPNSEPSAQKATLTDGNVLPFSGMLRQVRTVDS